MALNGEEAVAGVPAPRSLVVASIFAAVVAIQVLLIGVPASMHQRQADAQEQQWRRSLFLAATDPQGITQDPHDPDGSKEVERLLKGRWELGHQTDLSLYGAARLGRTAVVATLLKHGAHPDSLNRYRGSALIAAIENGKLGTMQVLLRGGAYVNSDQHFRDYSFVEPNEIGLCKSHMGGDGCTSDRMCRTDQGRWERSLKVYSRRLEQY